MKKRYFLKTLMLLAFALLWIGNGLKAQNTSFLEFDGDDSFYVNDASNKLDVNGLDWTIELWVYPTTVPASGTYPAILSRKYSFELYFRNTNGNLGFGIVAFKGSGDGFTSEASLNSSTHSMSLNEWHHLAVSSHYSGGTRTTGLYLDGTRLYYSTDPDFSLDASIAAIDVGARYDGSFKRYVDNCGMDEIRYSKTARYTSTSFTINTTSAPFTTDNNTILLYHLNENTGTSIANDNDHDFDASLRSSPHTATWRSWDYHSAQKLPLACIWTGTSSVDWGTTGNWDSGTTPVPTDGVVIPDVTNDPLIGSGTSATCTDLTIESSGVLSILGDLTVNGTLTVSSDATGNGSLIAYGTLSSNATVVQRYIAQYDPNSNNSDAGNGWHLLSSPVNNMAISGSNFAPTANEDDLYAWDESTNTWLNYQVTGNNITNFTDGEGYLVAYKTTATKSFTGTLNNSDISFSNLSYTSAQGNGWHLLGNPFPSALTWGDANWSLTNVAATAQIWNENAGNYTVISSGGKIPSTNGFFVQVTNSTNSLTIPKDDRVHDAANNYKSSSNQAKETLKFKVTNEANGYYDVATLGFKPEATADYDLAFDSHKLFSMVKTAPSLYTVSKNQNLSTDYLPETGSVDAVPVDFIPGVSTVYHLQINGIESFNQPHFVLEDTQTGTMIDLSQQTNYDFSATKGDDPNRFVLHINGVTAVPNVNKTDGIQVFAYGHTVYLHGQQSLLGSVSIFNTLGQQVYTGVLNGAAKQQIRLNQERGVYFVRLKENSHVITKKIFIQ